MKWEIVKQIQRVKGVEFEVDVKDSRFRPASKKEIANGDAGFKPMCPTLSLTFRHVKGGGLFKITAQYKKPKVVFHVTQDQRELLVESDAELSAMFRAERLLKHKFVAKHQAMIDEMISPAPKHAGWMFNLHEPPVVKLGRTIKESSGTKPLETFFSTTLPARLLDDDFIGLIADKFDESLSAKAEAA